MNVIAPRTIESQMCKTNMKDSLLIIHDTIECTQSPNSSVFLQFGLSLQVQSNDDFFKNYIVLRCEHDMQRIYNIEGQRYSFILFLQFGHSKTLVHYRQAPEFSHWVPISWSFILVTHHLINKLYLLTLPFLINL